MMQDLTTTRLSAVTIPYSRLLTMEQWHLHMGQCDSSTPVNVGKYDFCQTLLHAYNPLYHRGGRSLLHRTTILRSLSRFHHHRDREMQVLPQVDLQEGTRRCRFAAVGAQRCLRPRGVLSAAAGTMAAKILSSPPSAHPREHMRLIPGLSRYHVL
jgi:hypothetical protein